MKSIPAFVVEYFMLGRTRHDAVERYTQDGGIVIDVWLAFAADPAKELRVLVAPTPGTSTVALGHALHSAIRGCRRNLVERRVLPSVSPLENFVLVTLYFDELIQIVLPMTSWWHKKNVSALQRKDSHVLEMRLESAILRKLGHDLLSSELSDEAFPDRRVIEAAPLAALIGVFEQSKTDPTFLDELRGLDPNRKTEDRDRFVKWIKAHAETIAAASRAVLTRRFDPSMLGLPMETYRQAASSQRNDQSEPPELIQRVFLDRKAGLAESEALCTIKSDAAIRVFDLSCRQITWAVIDSGIAASHPAFADHDAKDRYGAPILPPPTRVRAAYDLTRIDRIRNFDLTIDDDGSPERIATIEALAHELAASAGSGAGPGFLAVAVKNLTLIAQQLDRRQQPDWSLIEPLIALSDFNDARLISDHGTHVAGILGADWRGKTPGPDGKPEVLLQGVCPDINLYDLRVIHPTRHDSTESAVVAALEFVQWVNTRAAGNVPVIHGVNISMSIPHDVRSYGCGATPVCAACDRLVGASVVVVAAAGNRGWNEQEIGFGNFVFCSITDPGNARDVITVGSTHRAKPHMYGVSYFSSRGPTGDGRLKPDLVAPGEQIRGPIPGGAEDELDGTSMSAPFVSGAAAMLMARHRELIGKPGRVKQILCDSATDLGREKYFQGHGLLDVLRALQSV